ncbi:hypothetical protein [Lichenicoccus sp.]|uniref:hypothetical protein n=1 Tax=Lichenicoccus sp. TaxID=2781899 RepID=UPI003D0C08F3
MFAEKLSTQLLAALDRPDLRVVAEGRRIDFDASLDTAFRADPGGEVVLGAACLGPARVCAFHIRHALELSMLLDVAARTATEPLLLCDLPILAGLCAARTAALFWQLDGPAGEAATRIEPVSWLAAMAAERPPDETVLHRVWAQVRGLQGPSYRLLRAACLGVDDSGVPPAMVRRLAAIWHLLGPAEALMAQGGDQRLAVDPATGLNHYGCSHRPRPWAITFASSTASSLSERGFGGAELARLRLAAAAFSGQADTALAAEARAVRDGIGAYYGLQDDPRTAGSEVVLAASGTDCELLALALAGQAAAVSNILVAPEETGTGVPLAAAGRHFADDTSGRHRVRKGDPVAGFATETRVLTVAIRGGSGCLRDADDIARDCVRLARAEHAAGRHVLLHLLDLSKTGLLAPSPAAIDALQVSLGGPQPGERCDVVVDACQARVDPGHVRDYLARGWMVMITGSKFFTGPPFCGALLLPQAVARRLQAGALPAGLAAYSSRTDWPARVPAARHLPDAVNHGMVLRWQAALAEMRAFQAVPAAQLLQRLERFLAAARAAIAVHPDLVLIEVPAPQRQAAISWDRLQTILSFMVLEPSGAGRQAGAGDRCPLQLERARRLYRWLNADVSRALPRHATPAERVLARLLCHVGQPVPVAHETLGGVPAGALRISAGARVVSGEPSHGGLGSDDRIAREIADMRRVLDKITLLLRYWPAMARADPEPSYAPLPQPEPWPPGTPGPGDA